MKTVKEAPALFRSFLDGVVIFLFIEVCRLIFIEALSFYTDKHPTALPCICVVVCCLDLYEGAGTCVQLPGDQAGHDNLLAVREGHDNNNGGKLTKSGKIGAIVRYIWSNMLVFILIVKTHEISIFSSDEQLKK